MNYTCQKKTFIDITYLYAKDSYEAKHQLSINKRGRIDLKYLNNYKSFYLINLSKN